MKRIPTFLFCFFSLALVSFSQNETRREALGKRIEADAERLADRIERQAERTAARYETNADVLADRIERQAERTAARWEAQADLLGRRWDGDRNLLHGTIAFTSCPDLAYLGIESNSVSKEKAKKLGFDNAYGSYVSKVWKNSAAAKAGLQPFDYVYGVNDQRTSNNQSLGEILEDHEPGDEVTLLFVRKGERKEVKVKLGNGEDYDYDENNEESPFLGVSARGWNEDKLDGVSVDIVGNSTAEAMGMKDADLIQKINGYQILDWNDVEIAIQTMKPGDQVEVNFTRDGKEMSAKQAIKAYEESDHDDDFGISGILNGDLWNNGNGGNEEGEDEDSEWNNDDDEDGDRGFLGVMTESVSEEKARKLGFENPHGAYITSVLKNGAGEKAGMKPLDYVFGIDEYRTGMDQSLVGILTKFKPGDKGKIHLIRKGQKTNLDVTFGKQSDAQKVSRNSCEDPFFGIDELGEDVNTGSDEGVKIFPVEGTTAEEMGLKSGDVITSINGYKMIDWTDITLAIEMLNPGETISVEFLRNGQAMKAAKPIKSLSDTKKCKDCDCGEDEGWNDATKPDYNYSYNYNWNQGKDDSAPRMDISKAKISVEEFSSNDVSGLKSKGIQLGNNNSLTVERLNISPNPSEGMFKLDFNLPSSGETVVRVFNTAGRTIYEYELGKFSGNFSDDVDISQNGAGNYFLQISQGGKEMTKKLVLSSN